MKELLSFTTDEFIKSDDMRFSQNIYYINKERFLTLPFLLKINIIKRILSKNAQFYFSKNHLNICFLINLLFKNIIKKIFKNKFKKSKKKLKK